MLSVKTKVRNSEINGLGVFAAEDIPTGAVVWEYHPQFEHEISEEELLKLSEVQRMFWFHYGYYDLSRGCWQVSTDDSRFMNHSNPANTIDKGNFVYAIRAINAGEEITCNYHEFYKPNPYQPWLGNLP